MEFSKHKERHRIAQTHAYRHSDEHLMDLSMNYRESEKNLQRAIDELVQTCDSIVVAQDFPELYDSLHSALALLHRD